MHVNVRMEVRGQLATVSVFLQCVSWSKTRDLWLDVKYFNQLKHLAIT